MRKYDVKNKRNIGIIIVISVIIIVMFSLFIKLFLGSEKEEYQVLSGTLVFDVDKTIIKLDSDSIIKTKWNNDYYLIYNDDDYELGDTAIAYKEDTGEIYLYGKYYEVSAGDEINVTSGETVIKNSALTKFYKLADRKYLIIDSEIKSSDGLLSTSDFLMIDLDKVGNATLTNHKVSLKTFSETVIVTSNYTFDIANEILTYGSDMIDMKKIIGSSNTYTKDDLVPEESTGGSGSGNGVTDVTDNTTPGEGTGTGTGSGDGNGSGGGGGGGGADGSGEGNNNTIIEEIKKASKNTSIVSVTTTTGTIDIDYVIYDPYNEYISVYMEVYRGSNNLETIHLKRDSTNYVISDNIVPNTYYRIVFKCNYIDPDALEEVTETIDDVTVTTKLPNIGIKVTSTSPRYSRVTYQITTDNNYAISSGTLTVFVNGEEKLSDTVSINGNTVGTIVIPDLVDGDIIEFKLDNIKSLDTVIKDLNTSYTFKY